MALSLIHIEMCIRDRLKGAKTRFVSPARFIATVQSADGKSVDFVFERQGLRWRLTDILLPKLS